MTLALGLVVAGAVAVTVGMWMLAAPVGVITAGVFLLGAGFLVDLGEKGP